MWRFLLSSLILHGLVVLLFFLLANRRSMPQPENVQFEIVENSASLLQKVPLGSLPKGTPPKPFWRSNVPRRGGSLKKFVPKFGIGKPRVGPALPKFEESNDDEVTGFANGLDFKTHMETMHFYQAVWNKINEKFYFPLELADMYIDGDVTVHIEVDKRGTFKGRLLKIQASNPLLQAFALAVVFKGLKFPLNERFWHSSEALIPLSLQFHFEIYLEGDKISQGGLLKNHLRFERYVQKDPKVVKQVRDFMLEYKIPMIIPIPGGAMLDVVQAVQLIRSIGKPGPKALEQIQRNRLKEQFETTLKDVQGP